MYCLSEASIRGLVRKGETERAGASTVSRRIRAEGGFDCYLQYFRKVYINKGDLISEWLLEASREPF